MQQHPPRSDDCLSTVASSTMKFKFKCQCGKILVADSAAAGKKAKCPQCGQIVQIPAAPEAGATEPNTSVATQTAVAEAKPSDSKPAVPSPTPAPAPNPTLTTSVLPQPTPVSPVSSAKELPPVPLDDFELPAGENGGVQIKPAFSDMPFLKGRGADSAHARSGKALPASSGEKTVQADSGTEEYGLVVEKDEACPKCGRPMTKQAVLCINCGYNRKTGATIAGVGTPTGGKKSS
jgi:DNA-directed RNA polymerase subunit M/transcription elongation factor TFIIS